MLTKFQSMFLNKGKLLTELYKFKKEAISSGK